MASGDTLLILTPLHASFPATGYGVLDSRNTHPVLDFDAATQEKIFFEVMMPRNYDGGGVTVTIVWSASSATSGTCVWEVGFERHSDDDVDLDSDSFASLRNTGAVTAPSASGEVSYDTIAFTDGAQMDSVAAGESFRLDVERDADSSNATDDMAGDAELWRVEIRET